jgi:hypothetical protein
MVLSIKSSLFNGFKLDKKHKHVETFAIQQNIQILHEETWNHIQKRRTVGLAQEEISQLGTLL